MRITPLDLRQQQFTIRMFRGFDPQEVDAFLEDVAEDYEAVLKENALLKEQLAALEARAKSFTDMEQTLRDTLLTAQRLTDELKTSAAHEAELLVREAELKSDKLLEEARAEEARIRTDLMSLKRARHQIAESIRATLESYQRLVDTDLKDEE
jgi:cell division initiation protein